MVVSCVSIGGDGPVGPKRQMGAKTDRKGERERRRLCLSPFSPLCYVMCEMQLPAEQDGRMEVQTGER